MNGPFSNTPQGHLSEFRTTAHFSRVDLKVTGKFGANDVTGYVEADFSGNDAVNVYQSVNGRSNRLRLYFMDLKRGKWEFLGGHTWNWLTPNRQGLGPIPADLAITYNEDQNIGVGLPYTRAAEFRAACRFNDHWAMGLGIENPNQFVGEFVALPAGFSTTISSQFDNGSQIGAPNLSGWLRGAFGDRVGRASGAGSRDRTRTGLTSAMLSRYRSHNGYTPRGAGNEVPEHTRVAESARIRSQPGAKRRSGPDDKRQADSDPPRN